MEAKHDLGHHAERPLAAEEELAQRRSDRGAWDRLQAHAIAARQHGLEPEAEVLDVAVLGRELARGAGCDPAADGGPVDRLRVVAGRVAARLHRGLVRASHHARLHAGVERRLVQLEEPVHGGQVDDQCARRRCRAADHARAPAIRDHGDAVPLRGPHRGRHLGRAPRSDDAGRAARQSPLSRAQVGEYPVVGPVGGQRCGILRDAVRAQLAGESSADLGHAKLRRLAARRR